MMCIAALALPAGMDMIAMSRLRSSISGLSGLLQASRSIAIKKNLTTSVHFTTVSGRPVAYMKAAGDTSALDTHDQQQWFAMGFSKTTSPSGGPPEVDPSQMGTLTSDPIQKGDPSFNARGLPCVYDATSSKCDPNNTFMYYFSFNAPFGHVRWAALGITAAGRIRTFYWNGTAWTN